MTIKAQTGPGARPFAEPAIYVAIAVEALPEPYVPSERMRCVICDTSVWVDPLRYAALHAREHSLRVLCIECAAVLEGRRKRAGNEGGGERG